MTNRKDKLRALVKAGRDATRATLTSLHAEEVRAPAAVQTVIVYFDGNLPDNDDYLKQYASLAEHRESATRAAGKHCDRLQGPTREFLRTDARVRDCFVRCGGFHFDADIHTHSLAVPNVMFVRANRALTDALSRLPNVLAVQRDKPMLIHSSRKPLRTTPDPGGEHKNGYTWGWNHLKVPDFHRNYGMGKGVEIGLIDSGICRGHADLKNKRQVL